MTMPNKKPHDPIQKQRTLFQRQTTISSYGKLNNRLQSALKTSVSKSLAGEQSSEIDEASKQQAAKEKLEHKRNRQIQAAFENLDKAVEEDVKNLHAIEAKHELQLQQDGHDHLNYQGALTEIQKLRFVRLLRDFEESSEYENMYNQIDQETKAANFQIQNLVAQTFGNVKFQNDGPSLTLEKKRQPEDLLETEQNRRRPARSSLTEEQISDTEIIYSSQFHELLDERYEDMVTKGRGAQNQGLYTYREMQCHLMLMMSRRFFSMLYTQLLGETYIVQCCLIEMNDGQQKHADIKAKKKAHKYCHQQLVNLVKQIQIDRFMIYMVATYPQQMQLLSQKKRYTAEQQMPSQFDFLYKFANKMLKRLRKFLLSFNYLLIHGNLYMLAELCSTVKNVVTWGCSYFIDKLQAIEQEQSKHLKASAKKQEQRAATSKEQPLYRRGSRLPAPLKFQGSGKSEMAPAGERDKSDSPRRTKSAQTVSFAFQTPESAPRKTTAKNTNSRKTSILGLADEVVSQEQHEKMNEAANNKVINLLKTMYGMADEMDTCDFFNENQMRSDVVFGKVKERDASGGEGKSDEEEDEEQTSNIVEQVHLLERNLAQFDWLKFKEKKKISTVARSTGIKSFHELLGPDGQVNFLQTRSVDSEDSLKTDSSIGSLESRQRAPDEYLKPDKLPIVNAQPRSSLKKPKPKTAAEEEEDVLALFDDPYKYHGDSKATKEFKAYQQGDPKINREQPSVTFGKGTMGQNQKLMSQASGARRTDSEESKSRESRKDRSLSKTYQGTVFENQYYRFLVAEQYEHEIGSELISQRRTEMPRNQVITRDNVQEVISLQGTNKSFQMILANLLFSANNPFQEDAAAIQDTQYQDKLFAKIKNDYAQSGALSYVFYGKYRIFKSLLNSQFDNKLLQEQSASARQATAEDSEIGLDNSNTELARYHSQVKRNGTPYQNRQIQENLVDALTKRSRFLDISLILRQLERKSIKIDQEIGRRLAEALEKNGQSSTQALHEAGKDNAPQAQPYHSNQSALGVDFTQLNILDAYPNRFAVRSSTKKLEGQDGFNESSRMSTQRKMGGMELLNSRQDTYGGGDSLRPQETKRTRKANKRKQEQRVMSLLQMDDFRFYRPNVKEKRGDLLSGSWVSQAQQKVRKEPTAPVFNTDAEEFEEDLVRQLLTKHRKDEIVLQKGYLNNQGRQMEEDFESANGSTLKGSRGSKVVILEDEAENKRKQIREMAEQYRQRMEFRDVALIDLVDKYKGEGGQEEEDEYLYMDPEDAYENGGQEKGSASRFVSLLDFPANELNPYAKTEMAFLEAKLNESSSAILPSGSGQALSQDIAGSQGGRSGGHLSYGPQTVGERTATLGGESTGHERRDTLSGLQTRRGTFTDSKQKANTGSGPQSHGGGSEVSMTSFGPAGKGQSAAQVQQMKQQEMLQRQQHNQHLKTMLIQQSMDELNPVNEGLSPTAVMGGMRQEGGERADTEPDQPSTVLKRQHTRTAEKSANNGIVKQISFNEGGIEAAHQNQNEQDLLLQQEGEEQHDEHTHQIDEVFASFLNSGAVVPKVNAGGGIKARQLQLGQSGDSPGGSEYQDAEAQLQKAIELGSYRKRISTEIHLNHAPH